MAKKKTSSFNSLLSGSDSINTKTEKIKTRLEESKKELDKQAHIDDFLLVDDIIVDPELETTIRIQTEEEFEQFKENLVNDGKIRDAVVVTTSFANQTILVDGHHRLKASKELQAKYPSFSTLPVIYKDFSNRDELIIWMLTNQIGRRNISKEERLDLAFRLEGLGYFIKKAKENQGSRTDLQQSVTSPSIDGKVKKTHASLVDTHVAEIAQVSITDAQRLRRVKEENNDLYKEVVGGQRSISNAYKQIQKQKKEKSLKRPELEPFGTSKPQLNKADVLDSIIATNQLAEKVATLAYNKIFENYEEAPKLTYKNRFYSKVYGLDLFQAIDINNNETILVAYSINLNPSSMQKQYLQNLLKNAHYAFVLTIESQATFIKKRLDEFDINAGVIVINEKGLEITKRGDYNELASSQFFETLRKLLFWEV